MPYLNPDVMAKAIDRVVDSVAADYEADIRQLSARLATYEAALREIEAACNVKQWGVQTRELANYLGSIARKALEDNT